MATKKEKNNILTYKGKPLLRKDNLIYYGNAEDKNIVILQILNSKKENDLEISGAVAIALQTNTVPGKEKILKTAQRDGLFAALDLGEFWLTESLESK